MHGGSPWIAQREASSSILQRAQIGVGPMSDAGSLVARIRSDLKPLEAGISGHAYLEALEEHRVHPDSLKVFVGQQHHLISSDFRSIAVILSRQGMPSRRFWINILQGEAAALHALHAFARTLGLELSDLELFEPLPAAHAYCTFVAWLALYGSDAELAGALLVNFPTWGACCGRMRKALHQKNTTLHLRRSRSSTFLQTCPLSRRKLRVSFRTVLTGASLNDSSTGRHVCCKDMS